MLKGSLYITNKSEVVQNAAYQNCRIVALVENLEQLNFNIDSSHVTIGSILLPPFYAVSAENDGNMEAFQNLYYQHLASKEADCFICVVLAALARGFNILFYVPKDESELAFTPALMQYMFNIYGVLVGSENNEFQYNNAFNHIVCTRLYFHDLISYQEYFVAHPVNFDIDRLVIPKLIYDMGNTISNFGDEESYFQYFNFYKNSIKENDNQFLVPLITKGRKQC
jgi:hypothetical protein